MSILDGVGFKLAETMAGHLGIGQSNPEQGEALGKRDGTPLEFFASIVIDDMDKFVKVSTHEARLEGAITYEPLGGTFPIRDGRFNLFSIDPDMGVPEMTYFFRFTAADGETYCLFARKEIKDDPGEFDLIDDATVSPTFVHRGENQDAPLYGTGVTRFDLKTIPTFIASMEAIGDLPFWKRAAAHTAFLSFYYGVIRDEHFKQFRGAYDTRYENLVLGGKVLGPAGERQFFLASGAHDRGFPWGDGETFWDLLLVIDDGSGGWDRYGITGRILEGLDIDIEHGVYRYSGPLYRITRGYAASFSDICAKDEYLQPLEAHIEIDMQAAARDTVTIPFPEIGSLARKLSAPLLAALREIAPSEQPLGMHITPHAITVNNGTVHLDSPAGASDELAIDSASSFGEAEISTFRNIKEPTLLYGYLCGIRTTEKKARVQIHTRTLRDEREKWAKDQIDAFLGTVISRVASVEYLLAAGDLDINRIDGPGERAEGSKLFQKIGEPIVELNNDHFPTAVFQRRIVRVHDPDGSECLALEEDMTRMRTEAVGSDETTTVASIRHPDKLAALDRVLEETGFDTLVESRWQSSGKDKSSFNIALKPNFMFSYNWRDHTTYTDPELVGHLVKRLQANGFSRIALVEAQSTYGEYFDRRSVREMASYLKYDQHIDCDIVDLTEDIDGEQHLGPHLGNHPVPKTWRDADFRISFAKNKTHCYSFYTLTLKNVYGALPLANKFKEYHCDRDIYYTTIEYLTAFPVHYGLVDAHVSADGPFGIFADMRPNETETVIGGENLVAVDWVAASKMGIDPMISDYMRLAVEAFGKPEINLVGDGTPYRPWLNVPATMTLFANEGVDNHYQFGNLFFSTCAEMDESHFTHKSKALHIRLLRKLTVPLRRTIFRRAGEKPTLTNRFVNWLLFKLGY